MKLLRLNTLSVLICALALTADLSSLLAGAQSVQISKPSATETGDEMIGLPDTPAGKAHGSARRLHSYRAVELRSAERDGCESTDSKVDREHRGVNNDVP